MPHPGQRNFHLLMVSLLLVSSAIDQQDLGGWRAGRVSMITLGLAMVWLGRYMMDGFQRRDAGARLANHRLTELEDRVDRMEREARTRQDPFSPPSD